MKLWHSRFTTAITMYFRFLILMYYDRTLLHSGTVTWPLQILMIATLLPASSSSTEIAAFSTFTSKICQPPANQSHLTDAVAVTLDDLVAFARKVALVLFQG